MSASGMLGVSVKVASLHAWFERRGGHRLEADHPHIPTREGPTLTACCQDREGVVGELADDLFQAAGPVGAVPGAHPRAHVEQTEFGQAGICGRVAATGDT